jgi:tetratricopeptide (TPR) repeat protein
MSWRCLLFTLIVLAGPASAAGAPISDANELDALFARLKLTHDPAEAGVIESRIAEIWGQSPSDTANLLYERGLEAMDDDQELALELFGAVTELEPEFAEAWQELGAVNFALEAHDAAILSLERALALEPRHYGALLGMATIFEMYGNKKVALEALRRASRINPHIPDIERRVRALSFGVEGQRI